MYIYLLYVAAEVTLTASPMAAEDGQLCPEDIIFTCITQDATDFGTVISWYDQDNMEIMDLRYVFFMSQTLPHNMFSDDNYDLIIKRASLSDNLMMVNALVELRVNAEFLVRMGFESLKCGQKTPAVLATFNITGLDIEGIYYTITSSNGELIGQGERGRRQLFSSPHCMLHW